MAQVWPPKKNTAITIVVQIRNSSTGVLITGATGLDSEVSIDGGAFADCTNEATEIGTTGIYTLALTAAEMNGDLIIVQTKSTSANAITFVREIYTTPGTWTDGINASSVSANAINAAAIATDAITNAKIAADAIGAAELAADAATEIGAAVLVSLQTKSRVGAVAAGSTSTTAVLDAGANSSDSFYNGSLLFVINPSGIAQVALITAYVGATRTATITPAWSTTPLSTYRYAVVGQ